MRKRTLIIVTGVAAVGAATGGGIAWATNGDADSPLSGATRARAVAAALQATGGSRVTEAEVGDDGAAYSVEVKLADGRTVEVNLDSSFGVIRRESDDDGAQDTNEPDGD